MARSLSRSDSEAPPRSFLLIDRDFSTMVVRMTFNHYGVGSILASLSLIIKIYYIMLT